jgi:hypothetical protein
MEKYKHPKSYDLVDFEMEPRTRHQWLMPIILAFQRQRSVGSWFEASPCKWLARHPILKISQGCRALVAHACDPSYSGGSQLEASWGK